jgi:hypothetical protein
MAKKLVLLSVLAVAMMAPAFMAAPSVSARPKVAPACKDDVAKLQKELTAARDAQRKAEAEAAATRAELERVLVAEAARVKRLESQTGVAVQKLR